MKIKPSAAFCMCFVLYIAFFLILSCIISFQSAMESAVLTESTEALYPRSGIVMIDPGHGGLDGGAVGVNGTYEKDLNLQVATKLQHILHLFGVAADMTRTEDIMLGSGGETIAQKKVTDMRTRLAMVNEKPYLALLSIHMNSYPEEKYWGAQVFYSKRREEGKLYGEAIQIALRQFVATENKREAKRATDEIFLLKHAECPALIIECGFISNYNEEALLKTPEHQTKLAAAVAAGFLSAQYGTAS